MNLATMASTVEVVLAAVPHNAHHRPDCSECAAFWRVDHLTDSSNTSWSSILITPSPVRATFNLSSSIATPGLGADSIASLYNQFPRIARKYPTHERVGRVMSIVVIAFTAKVKFRTLGAGPPNSIDGREATF